MTITSFLTTRGKAIHLVSLGDLTNVVESGERLRAYCPIHGSDHQRSLSIDPDTGWGFCHCCHATVLVKATGSRLVDGRGNGYEQHDASGNIGTLSSHTYRRSSSPMCPTLDRRVRSATTLPHWQQDEVAALAAVAPLMREVLASSQRAQLYLNERGVPLTIVQASGVGYLSRSVWEQAPVPAEQQVLLKRWIGRIIFPLGSPDGQGFIGRTLLKWEPGIDENVHKALLDQPGAPRRWIKTSPAGWFGFDLSGLLSEWVVLVEGGFDRFALLAAGFPANVVVALVGTAARPAWLVRFAPQVRGVVLALDTDESGQAAMERLAGEFRQARFAVTLCPPPQDRWGKDWNERWRRLGPQSMWPLYEAFAQHHATRGERR
jgi:hypothetical protein